MFLKTMFVFISTSQWGSCSFSEPGSWGQFKSKLKSVEIQTWWLQHWLCSTQFWWKSVYFSVFWKFLIEYWPHSLHYILLPLIFIMWSSQPEVTELHMMRSQILRFIQSSAISQWYCQSPFSEEEIRKKQGYFERKHSLQAEHLWALHADTAFLVCPTLLAGQLLSQGCSLFSESLDSIKGEGSIELNLIFLVIWK